MSISDNRYWARGESGFLVSDIWDIIRYLCRYQILDIRISDAWYQVSGTEGKKHLPGPGWTGLSSFYVGTAGTEVIKVHLGYFCCKMATGICLGKVCYVKMVWHILVVLMLFWKIDLDLNVLKDPTWNLNVLFAVHPTSSQTERKKNDFNGKIS